MYAIVKNAPSGAMSIDSTATTAPKAIAAAKATAGAADPADACSYWVKAPDGTSVASYPVTPYVGAYENAA